MGARGPDPRRRHGPLSPERGRPPDPGAAPPRERVLHPARRGGRPPALPGGAAGGGDAPQSEPARRGDPRRGGGGAAARRLHGAPGARGRRVHLGQGVLGLEPDQPRRVPPDDRASEGPAARALPPGLAASLPPSRRPRHPEVRQPRHGGVPRPRPHRHGASARCSTRRSSCPCPPGVVLQAYLPDSHRVQRDLTDWALERGARGGAPIKLRIVKGANLAMERIEARAARLAAGAVRRRSRRSTPTTCACSSTAAGATARAPCISASPPTTCSTWPMASLLREDEGVEPWVEFEMLEGMANHQARAVQARAGGALALRAGGAGRGLRERHRLPRAAARREHRRGQLSAARVRPRAGLAGLGARARPVPRRARPRRSRVRCAAADAEPRGRVARGGPAGGRPGGAIRQ